MNFSLSEIETESLQNPLVDPPEEGASCADENCVICNREYEPEDVTIFDGHGPVCCNCQFVIVTKVLDSLVR